MQQIIHPAMQPRKKISHIMPWTNGKWVVLNAWELDGTGSGWSWMLGTGNIPEFSEKNLAIQKTRPGMQTITTN